MNSLLELNLLSPDLVVAKVSEIGVEEKFPFEIPVGKTTDPDIRFLDRLVMMFEIDMPQFFFSHEWKKEFERSKDDLERLVVTLYQSEFSSEEEQLISSFLIEEENPEVIIRGLLE